MDEKSGPLKMLRTKGLAQAQSSRLYIFYFSDPRSHWVYRKSQYYQGGMRCCLMRLLLKMLSDMLQNPQLLSHIHIRPKPKVKLSPTDSLYPAPPSSDVIATATNPRQIDLTDRDLGPTEMSDRSHRDCNVNSLFPFVTFRSHRDERSVPLSLPDQLSG